MNTAIAIAISLALGGAVGAGATAVTISFASSGPQCGSTAAQDEAWRRFVKPPPPLPTTGNQSFGPGDF